MIQPSVPLRGSKVAWPHGQHERQTVASEFEPWTHICLLLRKAQQLLVLLAGPRLAAGHRKLPRLPLAIACTASRDAPCHTLPLGNCKLIHAPPHLCGIMAS